MQQRDGVVAAVDRPVHADAPLRSLHRGDRSRLDCQQCAQELPAQRRHHLPRRMAVLHLQGRLPRLRQPADWTPWCSAGGVLLLRADAAGETLLFYFINTIVLDWKEKKKNGVC